MGNGMNSVLIDTHVLLWWFQGEHQLPAPVRNLVADPSVRVLVSAASAWEIAIKFKAGKLDAAEAVVSRFRSVMEDSGFLELPVSTAHALRAGLLEFTHKDPFDRMLAAQAEIENLPILSNDKIFDKLSVRRIW